MDRIEALRAYARLVELGSFTRTATELRIKQSTVSKWLASLEDELGVRLIDRTTRSHRVTDSGRRFYEHALSVVSAYDMGVADIRDRDLTLRGRIRMSLPVVFGRKFVVPRVAKFLRKHKGVEVEMVFSDRYVSIVEEGFDLAIRVGTAIDSTLRSHSLGGGQRIVVASAGYLNAEGTPKTPKDLEQHECLVHTVLGGRATWTFQRSGKSHKASVRGRVSANNSEATLALTRSGFGISMLADWLVDADLRAGRLVPLLESYEAPGAPVRALTPPGRHVPARVRALIAALRQSDS